MFSKKKKKFSSSLSNTRVRHSSCGGLQNNKIILSRFKLLLKTRHFSGVENDKDNIKLLDHINEFDKFKLIIFSTKEKEYCDDTRLIQFLKARNFVIVSSYEMLLDTIIWRRIEKPDCINLNDIKLLMSMYHFFKKTNHK